MPDGVDTPAPGFTYAMYGAIFLTIGAWGFTAARGKILVGLVVAALSFLLLPAVVQTATLRATGYIWQGRYTIVALAVALIVCAIAIGSTRTTTGVPGASLPRRLLILVGALFVVSQVWSLLNSMVRYSTGTGSLMSTFLLHSKWSPPGGNALWLFACALGVCALVVVILVESRRQESVNTTVV